MIGFEQYRGTNSREKIVNFLHQFIKNNDMSPTIDEISKGTKISRSCAYYHIRILRKKGRINYQDRKSRTIKLI